MSHPSTPSCFPGKPRALPSLPAISQDDIEKSQRLRQKLCHRIAQTEGFLPFSDYMEAVLYTPELGYYASAMAVFGKEGDFVTAPVMGQVFARVLARSLEAALAVTEWHFCEVGAGNGALAETLLTCLGSRLTRYVIVERSAAMRARQEERLVAWRDKVVWCDAIPEGFSGVVVANELLDAMPVEIFLLDEAGSVFQRGVTCLPPSVSADGEEQGTMGDGPDESRTMDSDDQEEQDRLLWRDVPASPELAERVKAMALSGPYVSEVGLMAESWVRDTMARVGKAVVYLVDYGYPRREYYHPERAMGTLRCQYHHMAHDDPLRLLGLQDLSAFVDFTAMAEAAAEGGGRTMGLVTLFQFLLDAGLDSVVAELMAEANVAEQMALANEVKRLTLPSEMGEAFKVLVLEKGGEGQSWGLPPGLRARQLRL